jgi:hypothetical protein
MNTIVFSKDRPFQLYSLLETFSAHVKDNGTRPNLIVQFAASNEDYLRGYHKLNEMFENVEFVDEKQYGYLNTFRAIVDEFDDSDEWMSFESDDTIYFNDVDASTMKQLAMYQDPYIKSCGRLCMSLDVGLYDISNFVEINNMHQYAVIDRTVKMTNNIQEMCLKYPFGVQGALHKVVDVKRFLDAGGFNTPIQTEIAGTLSSVFTKYQYVLANTRQVCTFCHFNNELHRYEETAGNERLHKLFNDGYVVDWRAVNIPSLEKDMRWFNGESIGRFPIFPWDIAPAHHDHILTHCLKKP